MLVGLCNEGETLAEAAARCAERGERTEAETLVALNAGSMPAKPLRSDGIAAVLRFQVEYAEHAVRMTPDPRHGPRIDRPIPAKGIREALKEAGYSVLRAKRRKDSATHKLLAKDSRIPRRHISRICSGAINDLSEREADAILVAIDRPELYEQLVGSWVDDAARHQLTVDQALDEIYELFWICRAAFTSEEERLALEDHHLLHCLLDPEAMHLPDEERQSVIEERFRSTYGRSPHPIPDSLQTIATSVLELRHREALEQEKVARREIGPPERVTPAYARDLIRRARDRGLIDRTQRPLAFDADRAPHTDHALRGGEPAHNLTYRRKLPLTPGERRLRQAERGIERELAEKRVLRHAPDLPREDPRRLAYENRFHILARKAARRAEFRKREFAEIDRTTDRPRTQARLQAP